MKLNKHKVYVFMTFVFNFFKIKNSMYVHKKFERGICYFTFFYHILTQLQRKNLITNWTNLFNTGATVAQW